MKKHILIVDDDPRMRKSLRFFLEASYKVVEAENGAEALTLLSENNSFDLVLTDIQMPLMSGLELLEEMKKRGIKIPSCVISGALNETIISRLQEHDCSDFLAKPFDCEDLILKIDAIFARG